ncbi:MAG: hypothetical protein NC200_06975 [Candidatus Gastranaerophilales bacterium]|nr:hypothetical protein [Candidatus Gastranaerophilales bacterium]
MGMSASQVRFLSLQSRKNSIGRQLLTLSNRKMALSRDMNTVALRFTNALNQTNLKWSNDSGSTYNTLTYDLMMRPNDLNTEKPYIVTKATSGEVVLNDDVLTDKDGNPIIDRTTGQALSYVDIAKMISAYSGMDNSGNCQFNNISNIQTQVKNGVTSTTGGGKAIDNAYYIPSGVHDYSFDNSLRYTIFEKMGLVSESDKVNQLNLLNQLYGSEKAEKTGVYPIGSAWGDYYVALAKLEAYEDFLGVDHYFADAETFSGSQRTSETKDYSSKLYNYHDDIKTTSGLTANTVISQEAYSNNATGTLSHIDFNAYTSVAANGNTTTDYRYTTAEDGTVTTNGSFNHDYSKYEENDARYTDYTYSVDVSADGIKYQYKIDDIWSNAKANYSASHTWDPASGAGRVGTGDHLVEVGDSGNSKLSASSCKSNLENLVNSFANVLSCASSITIKTSALNTAKQQTVDHFINNADSNYDGASGCHSGSKKATKKAKPRAEGKNHIGISRYGGIHSHSKAYVDCNTLFNTFISFYTQAVAGDGVGSSSFGTTPSMSFDDENATQQASTYTNIDGAWYVNENYKDGNTIARFTHLLTTTVPDDMSEYGADIFVLDTTTGNLRLYAGSADDSLQKYYYVTDENAPDDVNEDTLMYDLNGFAWDDDNDMSTPEKTIYGTLQHGDNIYYFETAAQLNTYLSTRSLSSATLYEPRTFGDTSASEVSLGWDAANSKYGISIKSDVHDTGYRSKLVDDVNKAEQRIHELEENIDNLYSSADKKIMDYYDALFLRIAEQGWIVDENTSVVRNEDATSYLNNKLQNNDYFITECSEKTDESGYNYSSKMATSIRKIYQVHDSNAENQALIEYETEKSAISMKERRIDAVMQKLETEQEAINTTLDSVQKIIQENIDKTFKMFA